MASDDSPGEAWCSFWVAIAEVLLSRQRRPQPAPAAREAGCPGQRALVPAIGTRVHPIHFRTGDAIEHLSQQDTCPAGNIQHAVGVQVALARVAAETRQSTPVPRPGSLW